jgi:hypothetical protein
MIKVMKQFIKEWIINMAIALAILGYIGIVMLGIYLLDNNTLKGFIYVGLWILFVIITTITSYVRYQERRKK